MSTHLLHKRGTWITAVSLLAIGGVAAFLASRGGKDTGKLKIAYLGLTCEAPLFVAVEKGFCKEEGLDVELVATNWDGLREGLGLGRFDASQTLLMYLLKPIAEQGLDVKITGGIHTGCLRVLTGAKSPLNKPQDLRGKTIGVPTHLGSPPHLFAARVLAAQGIDPGFDANQVTWLPFDPDLLGEALETGRVDAVATSDPIGTILLGAGGVKCIADQAVDAPFCDEFCCVVVLSGKLARENPDAAARLTRALLKASQWTHENPSAAAHLSVEKKYVAASVEINGQALSQLRYIPGIAACRESIEKAARDMQKAGLLKKHIEPKLVVERAWLDLDGVNDERLKTVVVERVIGGGRPAPLPRQVFAELCRTRAFPRTCCTLK